MAAKTTSSAASASDTLIDTNAYIGQWPTRRLWTDQASGLLRKMRPFGVTSAWVGSFEGVLREDVADVNERLAEACAREGEGILVPFGTVNPVLPAWQEDLRRCCEVHRMPGIRLHPNYHGYTLDDPRFVELMERAARCGLLVQIALSLEDARHQHPLLRVPVVQVPPLLDRLEKLPGARVMFLNGVFAGNNALLRRVVDRGIGLELSTLEGAAGIERLLRDASQVRLAFGTYAPYFYYEAAVLKLQESALDERQLAAVRHGNAQALLRG